MPPSGFACGRYALPLSLPFRVIQVELLRPVLHQDSEDSFLGGAKKLDASTKIQKNSFLVELEQSVISTKNSEESIFSGTG